MNIKKISAFFITVLFMLSVGVCVHAANFDVVGEENGILKLPDGEAYKPYAETIEMVEGNENYEFERPGYDNPNYEPGIWPNDFNITKEGVFYGTSYTNTRFKIVGVLITSKIDGTQRLLRCQVAFKSRSVIAHVVGGTYPYDGKRHTATVTFYDEEDNLLENVIPRVRYGSTADDLAYVQDVGDYPINITSPSGCNMIRQEGDTCISITALAAPNLSANSKEVKYTGQPQGLIFGEDIFLDQPLAGYQIEYKPEGSDVSQYTTERPSASGNYDVRVYTTNKNYAQATATAVFIIKKEGIDFNLTTTDTFEYNGEGHAPTVAATKQGESFNEYTVSYSNEAGQSLTEEDLKDGKPYKAGTYRINITFDDSDQYTIGTFENNTFTIEKKEIIFNIPKKTYSYIANEDNVPIHQTPVVEPIPEEFTGYTVQYQRLSENGNPIGEPADYISEIGTYRAIYILDDPDNYTFGTGNDRYVTVADKILNFKFENLTVPYKRNTAQYADVRVTTEGELYPDHYSVVYTRNDIEVPEPTNAGRYAIEIIPIHGHGVGELDPEDPHLTITQQEVTFSVAEGEETSVGYDGKDHTVNVTPNEESDIIDGDYIVKYRNRTTNVETDAVRSAGEYDIVVKVTNSNYRAVRNIIGTFKVNTTFKLELGNSPAAMIFKDEVHTNIEGWPENVFNEFLTNRKFDAERLPARCTADVYYGTINELDLDSDVNTVIVKNIDDFEDPGIVINGIEQQGSAPEPVDGVEGLYRVAYDVEGQTLYRYVMVVNTKIGDVNGDGFVNAIDANHLDKKNVAVNGVTEARIWDVNNDGILNRDDADAIRNRFRTKLVPYYSWIK